MKNSFQENFIEVRKKIDTLIFFDDVDMAGSFMPLESLKERLESAPHAAREHDDFKYLLGLFAGRAKLEQKPSMADFSADTMNIISEDGKIKAIGVSLKKIMSMPLNDLENYVECAPDTLRKLPEFGFLVGYLDGQLIIEEYGGVDGLNENKSVAKHCQGKAFMPQNQMRTKKEN